MAKVIVIGAGPAGIMAAITASKNHEVILLDGNDRVGKKLFITGDFRSFSTTVSWLTQEQVLLIKFFPVHGPYLSASLQIWYISVETRHSNNIMFILFYCILLIYSLYIYVIILYIYIF